MARLKDGNLENIIVSTGTLIRFDEYALSQAWPNPMTKYEYWSIINGVARKVNLFITDATGVSTSRSKPGDKVILYEYDGRMAVEIKGKIFSKHYYESLLAKFSKQYK